MYLINGCHPVSDICLTNKNIVESIKNRPKALSYSSQVLVWESPRIRYLWEPAKVKINSLILLNEAPETFTNKILIKITANHKAVFNLCPINWWWSKIKKSFFGVWYLWNPDRQVGYDMNNELPRRV